MNSAILPVFGSIWRMVNFSPCNLSVTRKFFLISFNIQLSSSEGFSFEVLNILSPVNTRKAPNRNRIHWKDMTSAAPTPMRMARNTMTPRMPQNSTRCW